MVKEELLKKWEGVPGAELIAQGVEDLALGKTTEHSLLVLVGEPRLAWLNIALPGFQPKLDGPAGHALYDLLCELYGADAYGRYNSLLRRMNSFAHALERESPKRWGSTLDTRLLI